MKSIRFVSLPAATLQLKQHIFLPICKDFLLPPSGNGMRVVGNFIEAVSINVVIITIILGLNVDFWSSV